MFSKACGGAELLAFSRLKATGSTAMTWLAPGVRRALDGVDADAADAHDDHRVAGLDLRRPCTAEPQPVPTPHPVRQATSSGMSFVDLHRRLGRATVVTSANVPRPHIWPTGAVGGGDPEALGVVEAGADEQVRRRESQR